MAMRFGIASHPGVSPHEARIDFTSILMNFQSSVWQRRISTFWAIHRCDVSLYSISIFQTQIVPDRPGERCDDSESLIPDWISTVDGQRLRRDAVHKTTERNRRFECLTHVHFSTDSPRPAKLVFWAIGKRLWRLSSQFQSVSLEHQSVHPQSPMLWLWEKMTSLITWAMIEDNSTKRYWNRIVDSSWINAWQTEERPGNRTAPRVGAQQTLAGSK
jgi:hypothetical protein